MENSKKVVPQILPGQVYQALEDIVGKEWISQDRAVCETYSCNPACDPGDSVLRKHLKDPTCIPACVVLPESTAEVQAIMRVASRYKVPVVPWTNGQMTSVPSQISRPAICIHLRRMDKILDIDVENMTASVQAFVNYAQLQAETMKLGLWNGGTPGSTTICKFGSHVSSWGFWQTDLKYATLMRNIISVTWVLPDGEVMKTGSAAMPGAGNFFEYAPGPDLLALAKGSIGTAGIFTEVTMKLHTWVGGAVLPEDAGRPSIANYYKMVEANEINPGFDRPPTPDLHKIFWFEFPDMETEVEALYQIGQSGIGIALNATGVYNAFWMCATQELSEKRERENFCPPFLVYAVLAGITSEDQLAYEEKVLRAIVGENRGKFLSKDYKPDVLESLGFWNLDVIRATTFFRMNRPGGFFCCTLHATRIDRTPLIMKNWSSAIERLGPISEFDRGGAKGTPFVYMCNRGHHAHAETDNYFDQHKIGEVQHLLGFAADRIVKSVKEGVGGGLMNYLLEPFTSLMGSHFSDAHILFRKFREVIDPLGISATGKVIYTEEEFNAIPPEALQPIRAIMEETGLKT